MKILIINRSDVNGGAAVVSYRLMHALQAKGVEAKMLVMEKLTDDADVSLLYSSIRQKVNFIAERAEIFLNNGFNKANVFKVSTALWGNKLSQHPLVQEADVIALNWINQGMLSLNGIEDLCKLGKPILWTMHDMWECTGICHHAYECSRYMGECKGCQFLGTTKKKDLSTKVQALKSKLYNKNNIHFIAVSHWLAERCRDSSLLKNEDVSVIYNAFPIGDFDYHRRTDQFKDIPVDKKVLVMGAARLDDPIKGMQYFIDATRFISERMPKLADKLHVLLYGNIRDESLLHKFGLPVTYLGRIDGHKMLEDVYTHSDIVVSTSFYETLPGTLIEGQACGCMPVTFGNGGQRDIVEHRYTGYIADYKSAESIAQGISWAVQNPTSRDFLHSEVERKFSADKVAESYIKMIEKLK